MAFIWRQVRDARGALDEGSRGVIGPVGLLGLALCLIGNICSSIGFKQLATQASFELSFDNLLRLVLNPWGWLGLAGGLTFVGGYILLLRTVPISAAYPTVVAMGSVGVAIAGVLFLGEHLTMTAIAGIALIIAGVLLVGH